jgi:hypothetical protein
MIYLTLFCLVLIFISFIVLKREAKIEISEEVSTIKNKINPIYNDILNNDNITKLKIDMVKSVAEIPIIPESLLTIEEKVNIIETLIKKIPLLLKESIRTKTDITYLFPAYIPRIRGNDPELLFKEISNDLQIVLSEIGISSEIGLDGGCIRMKTDSLMKFCNYEKLSQTVELLK